MYDEEDFGWEDPTPDYEQWVERAEEEYLTSLERDLVIDRLEEIGFLDPSCAMCQEMFYPAADPTSVFAPRHKVNPSCRSGGHPHCTCDSCF